MKVVVTSASGQLGSLVVSGLAANRKVKSVVALDVVPPSIPSPKTTWTKADMRDPGLDRHFEGADALIHLAFIVARRRVRSDARGERGRQSLPTLDNRDVADLLQVVRVRVLRMLVRAGVIEDDPGKSPEGDANTESLCLLDDGFAERDPALFALAHSAVTGLRPAGPEHRESLPIPIELRGSLGVTLSSALSALELGFSLHAATTDAAGDAEGREALVRYILRPPIAQDRVELLPGDLVRIRLRRPFRDGTFAVDLDPLSLLRRLAASVPPPHFHVVRYAGILAPASKLRPLVVPPPPPPDEDDASPCSDCSASDDKPDEPSTHRAGYRPWRELMLRSFAIDVEKCERCGAPCRTLPALQV